MQRYIHCVYTQFVHPPVTGEHLGHCMWLLHTEVLWRVTYKCLFVCMLLITLGNIYKMAGSCGKSLFDFLRNYHIFQRGWSVWSSKPATHETSDCSTFLPDTGNFKISCTLVRVGGISQWLSVAFSLWPTLITFSCSHWYSCRIWWSTCSNVPPILKVNFFLLMSFWEFFSYSWSKSSIRHVFVNTVPGSVAGCHSL
jgi:hypothetical protein